MSTLSEDLALLFVNEQRWIIPDTLIARPAFRAAAYLSGWAGGGPPPQQQEFAAFMRQGSSLKTSLTLTFLPASLVGDKDPYIQVYRPLVMAGRVQIQKRRYYEYKLSDADAGHAIRARVTQSLLAARPVPLRDALIAVIMFTGGLWKWCAFTEPPSDGTRPVAVAPEPAGQYVSRFVIDLTGGQNPQPQPGPLQGRANLLAAGQEVPDGAPAGVLAMVAAELWQEYSKEWSEHRPGAHP